jgi:hypothetical protein
VTLEQAGFEIRDQIMWIYSSGFPKSQDVGISLDRQSGTAAHKAELAEVKALLKQLYAESGKSTAEISRECGFNAGGYLKTDFKDKGWANNLPKDDKWITLKSVLGCGDDYDDYFITTPQVKVGEKSAGCFDQEFDNYTIGARSRTVDITASQTEDGKQWAGWGTALKPAHEPIALARKPMKLTIAKNCRTHGVGALNIDATRIPYENDDSLEGLKQTAGNNADTFKNFSAEERTTKDQPTAGRRTASFHNATGGGETQSGGDGSGGWEASQIGRFPSNVIGDIPDYQKYFYCPKVSRRERHIGFDTANIPQIGSTHPDDIKKHPLWDPSIGGDAARLKQKIIDAGEYKGNNHPTVKPIELMKYLIKLVTPPGGTVLDPFNGSGSTGCAAVELGMTYIGCELDPAYVEISTKRIAAWNQDSTTFDELFE